MRHSGCTLPGSRFIRDASATRDRRAVGTGARNRHCRNGCAHGDPYVNERISLADDEVTEQFVRSPGPGGQNVNKLATAVQLRFDARKALSPSPKTCESACWSLRGRGRRSTARSSSAPIGSAPGSGIGRMRWNDSSRSYAGPRWRRNREDPPGRARHRSVAGWRASAGARSSSTHASASFKTPKHESNPKASPIHGCGRGASRIGEVFGLIVRWEVVR